MYRFSIVVDTTSSKQNHCWRCEHRVHRALTWRQRMINGRSERAAAIFFSWGENHATQSACRCEHRHCSSFCNHPIRRLLATVSIITTEKTRDYKPSITLHIVGPVLNACRYTNTYIFMRGLFISEYWTLVTGGWSYLNIKHW